MFLRLVEFLLLKIAIKIVGMMVILFVGISAALIDGDFNPATAQQGLQIIDNTEKKPPGTEIAKPRIKKSALSKSLQVELNRLGCKAGSPDGQWGRGSQRALDRLTKKQPELKGAKRSGALLARLQGLPNGACATVSVSQTKNEPVETSKTVAQTDVKKFDGRWKLDVRLGGLCSHNQTSLTVAIVNGKISSVEHNLL